MREAELLRQVMLAASAVRVDGGGPACVLWRQQVGLFMGPAGHQVRVGLEGQADLGGVLAGGRAVQIETKSPTGRVSPAQERWAAMCRRMGVLYVLARSVEDATSAIEESIR